MSNVRIIARLDIKGPNLVKGIQLEGLRVLGKPEDFAGRYYNEGMDELIYIDAVASLYGRDNLLEIVKRASNNIFIPLTAGGGIRNVDDIRQLLLAGADKVAINTAAINNPSLIREASKAFGSQCIVVSIAAKRRGPGHYEAFTDNGREATRKDVFDWAREAVDLGAGELLITGIDQEGTGKGFDLELIGSISRAVPVPVIACGGAGNEGHFLDAIKKANADAVCASSVFHYHRMQELISTDRFKEEGNVDFIKNARSSMDSVNRRMRPMDVSTLKQYLAQHDVSCRQILERDTLNVT